MEKFTELGLDQWIIDNLSKKGFTEPSPIQAQTIPALLGKDHDIIGQAQTGTGKTAAFSLPIVQKITPGLKKTQALVLCPTRELAIQVCEEIKSFCPGRGITTLTVYGGAPVQEQRKALKRGVDIVVATPGRCIQFLESGVLNLADLQYLVLDEADEMLNMGFVEDVERILKATPDERTVLMFSATMPPRLKKIAESYMKNSIMIKAESKQMTMETIKQMVYEVRPHNKFAALCRIMDLEKDFYGIIFCRTKAEVEQVSGNLANEGYSADYIHGDVAQDSRERLLKRFRARKISLLIATDVAARGIDVNDLSHIVNYSLPEQHESYVHRIGRTGRAGKSGTAISLIAPNERNKFRFIEKKVNAQAERKTLPHGNEVVKLRLDHLMGELNTVRDKEKSNPISQDMAAELLKESTPVEVVSHLINLMLGDKLDAKKYPDINCTAADKSSGNGSKKRASFTPAPDGERILFFAKGRRDGMNPKSVVSFLTGKSKVAPNAINSLKVFDKFCLFNAPQAEADRIIKSLKRSGKSPLVRFDREG